MTLRAANRSSAFRIDAPTPDLETCGIDDGLSPEEGEQAARAQGFAKLDPSLLAPPLPAPTDKALSPSLELCVPEVRSAARGVLPGMGLRKIAADLEEIDLRKLAVAERQNLIEELLTGDTMFGSAKLV